MQTAAAQAPHIGARLIDGIVTVIVGAMSAFWLSGAMATEPAQ